MRHRRWLDEVTQDFRHGYRALMKTPTASATSLAILALAMGLVLAAFTTVNAIFIRPWPVHDPGRVFVLKLAPGAGARSGAPLLHDASYAEFVHLRANAQRSIVEAFHRFGPLIGPAADATREDGLIVTPRFFETLGIRMQRGRAFKAADADGAVAIISDALWRRRFGTDPDIVGQTIVVSGVASTIVGVTPPGFPGVMSERKDVYVPFPSDATWTLAWQRWWGPAVDANQERLGVGVTLRLGVGWDRTSAATEIQALDSRFTTQHRGPRTRGAVARHGARRSSGSRAGCGARVCARLHGRHLHRGAHLCECGEPAARAGPGTRP